MILGIDGGIKFEVSGEPRGKGRPRFTARGGFGRAYTDKATRDYEELIRSQFLREHEEFPPLDCPLMLILSAHMPIPKSTSRKNREGMLCDKIYPTKKPDIDNIIKIVMDALNGMAYIDDKQIVAVQADKSYSDNPRLIIGVERFLTIAGTEVQG